MTQTTPPDGETKLHGSKLTTFEHELFILHAEADEPFVCGHLLPAIGLAPGRVVRSSMLIPGKPTVAEIERCVQTSRFTIAVLSPAYMTDHWVVFGEQLAGHAGGERGRLIPLLLADCEVPLRLDFLVALDFRDPDRWVEEAHRLRARLEQPALTRAPAGPPCPYPGMRAYSADIAAHFHGREAEVDEILGRLRAGEREIYVIGPSGSGKSSLVAAGVVPRLNRGISGLGPFVVRTMRPGERPATRLCEVLEGEADAPAAAVEMLLARSAPGVSTLIVVDQLEELFVQAREDEYARFLTGLRGLRAEPRCVLVFTLRADFYGALMESPLWEELHGQISRIEVAPLRGAALRRAIEQPARDVGVYFEPELVERLLGDAASEPGILPLLQETLIQLWDRRQRLLLTVTDYESLGSDGRSGLAVAISRRADASLRALTSAQEAIARRILLRLVSFGEGRSDTRRQQPLSALRTAGDSDLDFDAVLRRLVSDRLLTTDGGDDHDHTRVDLAHEVMITAWPALAAWIRTRRSDEQRRRQLEAAAANWNERGRGNGGLLDPIELAEAEAWRRTDVAHDLGESSDIAAFIEASRHAHEKRRRRRRRLVWSAFGALIVFSAVILALAIAERRRADEAEDNRKRAEDSRQESQRRLALSYEEAGRRLVAEGRLLSSLPYLVAAREEGEEGPPLRMLFWAATRFLPLPLEHQGSVRSAAFSPDGTRVVTGSADKTARIWDATTGKPLTPALEHQKGVNCVAFSPDGSRVATASEDKSARVWDATTGQPLSQPLEHQGRVRSIEFSPDGTRVVTASHDKTARVWDAATGKPLFPPLAHQDTVYRVAFSPDGTHVVTASWDKTARVWDATTGKPLSPPLTHQEIVYCAAFSPDGTRVVTASEDKTARIWDTMTGKPVSPPLEHQGSVECAAFSPDGSRVVTASGDNTARIWNAMTGEPLTPPLAHQDVVIQAAFSPDGTRVVSASWDKTARIWDAATGKPLSPPLEHHGFVTGAAFSPDGHRVAIASEEKAARIWDITKSLPPTIEGQSVSSAELNRDGTRVVTASWDKTARVWNATTGNPLSPPLKHQNYVLYAAFSPDGTRVVTASWDKTARVWDATTGEPLSPPLEHQDYVQKAAFSPDGTRVVTASYDKTARIWHAATGHSLSPPLEHQDHVWHAEFSPDGTRVVTASHDKTARIWHAATGHSLSPPLEHQGYVWNAKFSPDGTRIVTASFDNTARIWDATTGRPLIPPLEHQDTVIAAAFSPDGTRVVTASRDNTAQVWDAATGKPLFPPLAHQGAVNSARFSQDGLRVVTASSDKSARVWDATTGKPLSPVLEHRRYVTSAAFHPDGTRILTVSVRDTVRIWEIAFDGGTLAQWSAIAERSPYVLDNGVLSPRTSRFIQTRRRPSRSAPRTRLSARRRRAPCLANLGGSYNR